MIKLSREDSWVAYVLFLTNRKQFLRYVYVYVAYWTFLIFGRGKNASDGIIWRTPCSTSADPRLKTSDLGQSIICFISLDYYLKWRSFKSYNSYLAFFSMNNIQFVEG